MVKATGYDLIVTTNILFRKVSLNRMLVGIKGCFCRRWIFVASNNNP
jgi:hypothetical protein